MMDTPKDYPFANVVAKRDSRLIFKKQLPHIEAAMPEFFRVLAIANQSIAQRDIYGMPQGIRHDLGIDAALKLLLMACFNDKVIHAHQHPLEVIDQLRKLVLQWYALGNALQSCLFFGYYFYTLQAQALYAVKNAMAQMEILADSHTSTTQDEEVLSLLSPTHSRHWYQSTNGIGDKLSDIFIASKDVSRTDLPKPGYQVHFKHSFAFDLRAPLFLPAPEVEQPQMQQDKMIVSCPRCQQKCRCTVYPHIEVTCPTCQQHWQQWT